MRSGLPLLMRVAGRPVMLIGTDEAADAKRRLLERAGAIVVGAENPEARLAIVAIEDEGEALAAIDGLRARGLLVNAVDRPALCDFTLPAIIDRDPVLVAISTGGASAGLAAALRQRLELLLPQGLGRLARWLGETRVAFADANARRLAIADGLRAGGAIDPLQEVSRAAFDRWLADPKAAVAGVHAIRVTSADPDDLTLRDARLLAAAGRICHRPGIAPEILARGRADAPRIQSDHPPQPVPGELIVDIGFA